MLFFEFSRPWALTFLLLLAPVILWHMRSIADMPKWRRTTVFILRLVILVCLVFALAGFRLKLPRKQLSVLFVVDSSLSISPENREWAIQYIRSKTKDMPVNDKAGVVIFGKDAYLEETLSSDPKIMRFSTITTPTHTDLGRAIQLASAVYPENTVKRMILITDGNQNLGDAVEEATLAATRSVEIFCVPYPRRDITEILVNRVEAPQTVAKDAPFALKVELDSTMNTTGMLNIFQDNRLIAREKVEVQEGKNLFTVSHRIEKPGNYRFRASIEVEDDRFPHNNLGETMVMVKGKPRVLYLANDPKQIRILGRALAEGRFLLEVGGMRELPESLSQLASYKAVIFDNLNGLALSPAQMQMIENYVKDVGGGFIMIGGQHSFGAGGYYKSPVERILPVSLDIRKRKNLPSVALVLCIDKSGSMSQGTGGVEKMKLAREAAIATLELLQPVDKIGVVGFDGAAKWVVVLNYAKDKKKIANEIASVRAGGGTAIYPALDSAYTALKNTQAMVKHVIVLTDGRSAPGDFKGITEKMIKENITVSAIGVGKDADMPFLEKLSKMGQGRSYYADEATVLPRIFVRETILAGRSPILEEPFLPVSVTPASFLKGINQEKLPKLLGYVITTPRARANLALVTHQDDPLLAYWRIGLGKSVAFTSDDGIRWAKDWLAWKDYSQFWIQLVRWVIPDMAADRYTVTTSVEAGRGKMVIEAFDEEGNPLNFMDLQGKLITPSGQSKNVTLSQTATGRYEAGFEASEVGTYMVNVVENTPAGARPGKLTAFNVPYSPEYKNFKTNTFLLEKIASITGGQVVETAFDVFSKTGRVAHYPRNAWPELLILALMLFPFDVALRRVYLPDDFEEKVRAFFTFGKKKATQETVEVMGALKARKDAVREKYQVEIQDTESISRLKKRVQADGFVKKRKVEPKKTGMVSIAPKVKPKKEPEPQKPVEKKPQQENQGTLAQLKRLKKKMKEKD